MYLGCVNQLFLFFSCLFLFHFVLLNLFFTKWVSIISRKIKDIPKTIEKLTNDILISEEFLKKTKSVIKKNKTEKEKKLLEDQLKHYQNL